MCTTMVYLQSIETIWSQFCSQQIRWLFSHIISVSLINIALLQEGRVKAWCIHPSIFSNSSLEFPLFLSELEDSQVFGAIENCDLKVSTLLCSWGTGNCASLVMSPTYS
jgi:hypothetical protein